MSFSLNVSQWTKEAGEYMALIHKGVILDLFMSVVRDTPVLEGRLRANWIISADNPANGTFDVIDPDGTKTTRKIEDFVSKLDDLENFNVFLANNLPYAYTVEYDGHSKIKAPKGMVRKNMIRITNNLANA